MSDSNMHRTALERLKRKKIIFELVLLALLSLILISGLHEFVAQPFFTWGDSMTPTFASDEYLAIDEVTYYFHKPQRGDVVIFRYPLDPSIFFIKRLIGLPGDTVSIVDGVVSIQNSSTTVPQILNEPYVAATNRKQETSTITLGSDEYFMLGDNRKASFDSRVWGPVPARYIIGRPIVRLYPLNKFSLFPGTYHITISNGSTTMLSTGKR